MSRFGRPPSMFIPHAGRAAPIIREGLLIRDLTMPRRNWRPYDEPAVLRARTRKEAA